LNRAASKCERGGEQGVFYVLFALIFSTILVFVLTLGLKSLLVRQVTAEIRLRASQICGGLAAQELFLLRPQAVRVFRDLVEAQFNNPQNPLFLEAAITLTEVSLAIPGMPQGEFRTVQPPAGAWPFFDQNGDGVGEDLATLSAGIDFGSLPASFEVQSCAGIHGLGDCKFYPVVRSDRFPQVMWNNWENAGNTVGCVVMAKLDLPWAFTYGPTEISAVYSHWKPAWGYFPEHDPAAATADQMPGLSIAVATQMTTDSSDARFRFPAGAWGQDDPLHDISAFPPPLRPNMMQDQSVPRVYPGQGSLSLTAPAQLSSAEDYRQMAAACMNPAILARDALLTTMVELAGRHGQLRASTEILHVGTQHRNLKDPLEDGSGALAASAMHPIPSYPAVIVPFGKDLLLPDTPGSYQLPYVFLNAGTSSNGYPAMGPKKGLIDGFNTAPIAAEWQRHNAMVAAQLRSCHHLFQCHWALSQQQPSCPSGEIGRLFVENFYNPAAESSVYQPEPALRKKIAAGQPGFSTAWDQSCPWGSESGMSCAKGGGPAHEAGLSGLTAAEVVSALGSTQACPYAEQIGGWTCVKPGFDSSAQITNDFRPDFRALMQYLDVGGAAIEAPGLFPAAPGYNWPEHAGKVFGSRYVSSANLHTHVLIVTHRAPGQDEADAIKAMLQAADEWQRRPLTIIFIPTSRAEAAGVQRLTEAFMAGPGDSAYHNRVYVLSPFSEDEPIAWGGLLDPSREAELFQTYWLELIEPSQYLQPNQSVIWRATRIFNNIVIRAGRKL
jgi:hypothetical protein